MDNTSRMVALLGAVRKNMNGAMLDMLRYYGADYGANYGVAIHTLRDMAREQGRDDAFARFLYRQQIRELRIIALWIAEADRVTHADFDFFAAGIVNSEVAEQAAQALLSRIDAIDTLLDEWSSSNNVLLAYAAMLAAARSPKADMAKALEAVARIAGHFTDDHLAATGATALLVALAARNTGTKSQVRALLATLPDSPTARSIKEETGWQIGY